MIKVEKRNESEKCWKWSFIDFLLCIDGYNYVVCSCNNSMMSFFLSFDSRQKTNRNGGFLIFPTNLLLKWNEIKIFYSKNKMLQKLVELWSSNHRSRKNLIFTYTDMSRNEWKSSNCLHSNESRHREFSNQRMQPVMPWCRHCYLAFYCATAYLICKNYSAKTDISK